MCSCESLKTSGRLLRRSIAYLKNASKSSENLKTFVVKGPACGRDGSFILAEPFAMLGRAKCQLRMALRGAALSHFYKLPRGRRNPPGVGRAGSHSRTWAARNAHCREWLRANNSPEGSTVTTRISYGCWPRSSLTNSGTGRCDKAAHLSERRATCLRGGLQVALA